MKTIHQTIADLARYLEMEGAIYSFSFLAGDRVELWLDGGMFDTKKEQRSVEAGIATVVSAFVAANPEAPISAHRWVLGAMPRTYRVEFSYAIGA